MNRRHAAALALVGWYLMVPPYKGNGIVDIDAPLSKWRVRTAHDTANDCQDGLDVATDNLKRLKDGAFKRMLEQQIANAQCIATDDPRLKQK